VLEAELRVVRLGFRLVVMAVAVMGERRARNG
jgi:hypothetical protein